ncbi:uncharacterized protein [Argopecten irradians]|uniref:uncharacterized protein isoform X2 n=1 Tax=Argopecten irradians TaxID=31199 RepID=UPI00371916F1
MATKINDSSKHNIPSLYLCKACHSTLKDPVKLSCGHRVYKDPCLSHGDARCPVTLCNTAIDLDEVKDDCVLRKAIMDKHKVNQMKVESDTKEKNIEMQSTSISNSQNRTSFQEDTVANIETTLACIKEDNRNIREQTKSLKINTVKAVEIVIKQHQDIHKQLRRQEHAISRITTMLQNVQADLSSCDRQVERKTNDIQALQRLRLSSGTRVLSPRNPAN